MRALHSRCLVASACLDQLSVWYLNGSNFSLCILVMAAVLCTHAVGRLSVCALRTPPPLRPWTNGLQLFSTDFTSLSHWEGELCCDRVIESVCFVLSRSGCVTGLLLGITFMSRSDCHPVTNLDFKCTFFPQFPHVPLFLVP